MGREVFDVRVEIVDFLAGSPFLVGRSGEPYRNNSGSVVGYTIFNEDGRELSGYVTLDLKNGDYLVLDRSRVLLNFNRLVDVTFRPVGDCYEGTLNSGEVFCRADLRELEKVMRGRDRVAVQLLVDISGNAFWSEK